MLPVAFTSGGGIKLRPALVVQSDHNNVRLNELAHTVERSPRRWETGIVLPVPQRALPLPSADVVEPWVKAIVWLWDDDSFYRELSDKARDEAQRWHPDRVPPMYAEFFTGFESGFHS